ncbi:MAG: putative toxin-antitoxin system toxin component, PIN family [Propionibacteriaceae bacterium]|jgi:putative PIN family toxin of toxin-antitoxin system|nr:putative toxin-antitoxin system toxin component, PIN family [Propionibacteriaceae bacterium]
MAVKVVIDTNVLVARTLTPEGNPARVVDAVLAGAAIACYDRRILSEYRAVLSRPRFGFDPVAIEDLLAQLIGDGLSVIAAPSALDLPDESDRPFAEVALTADAWLVTGNLRHFPGFNRAISPTDFLAILQSQSP